MKSLREKFIDFGLRDKQIDVYIEILEKGEVDVNELVDKMNFSESMVRRVLSELSEIGLIREEICNSKKIWVIENPKVLNRVLDKERDEISKKEDLVGDLIDEMLPFFERVKDESFIRYIDSEEDLMRVRKSIELSKDDIWQILAIDKWRGCEGNGGLSGHIEKLKSDNRKVKAILISDELVKLPFGLDVDFAILPSELSPFRGEVSVCGDITLLFSYTPEFLAIEIRSEVIAEMMRGILVLALQRAKQISLFGEN